MKYLSALMIISLCVMAKEPVLKTGQTISYEIGDDGAYLKGFTRSYHINGNGTVDDDVTGLTWQNDYSDNKGYATDGNTSVVLVFSDAKSYCEAIDVGGYTDWRLPEIHELKSLVDYSNIFPAIGDPFEATTQNQQYWSQTDFIDNTAARIIDYAGGSITATLKTNAAYVRCVRGSIASGGTYTRYNGTVIDRQSTLIWQDDYDGNPLTLTDEIKTPNSWQDAIVYCEDLDMLGFDDWRLPNINEFDSIRDTLRVSPALDPLFQHTTNQMYWSSTTYSSGSGTIAWYFYEQNGGDDAIGKSYKGSDMFVRCVRGTAIKNSVSPGIIMYLLN